MKEEIIFYCTIFATIIAYLTYKATATDATKEAKKILLEKFEFLKTLNEGLINDLTKYGQKNNSFEIVFMQGLTLTQCIDLLMKVKTDVLNQDNYNAIKSAKSKMRIDGLLQNIDIQIRHHSEVRTTFDYFIK